MTKNVYEEISKIINTTDDVFNDIWQNITEDELKKEAKILMNNKVFLLLLNSVKEADDVVKHLKFWTFAWTLGKKGGSTVWDYFNGKEKAQNENP